MKLIPLEWFYRSWLVSRHALTLDQDHNERFVGLTHCESLLYAKMSNPPFISFDRWEVDELKRFLELHERHEVTLMFRAAARNFMAWQP
jgi:hypothetical protein